MANIVDKNDNNKGLDHQNCSEKDAKNSHCCTVTIGDEAPAAYEEGGKMAQQNEGQQQLQPLQSFRIFVHPEDEKKEDELSSSSSSIDEEKKKGIGISLTLKNSDTLSSLNCSSSSATDQRKTVERTTPSSSSTSSPPISDDDEQRKTENCSELTQNEATLATSAVVKFDERNKNSSAPLPPEKQLPTFASSSTEEKKKTNASSILLDQKINGWLKSLKWRGAELETMSVLYAKPVPTNKRKNGPTVLQRVPLRDMPISISKSDAADRRSMLAISKPHHSVTIPAGSMSPPRMRHKQMDKVKHNDQQRSHHRSTVCLSSSAISPSLVMSRQSIVIVPAAGEAEKDTTNGDKLTSYNEKCGATECAIATDGDGTLTKFALSLPNDASLSERLMAQQSKWTMSSAARKPAQRVQSFVTMDYTELPFCNPNGANVYQPRIKYRRNRKGGSSASVNAPGAGHALSNERSKSPFSIADSLPLRSCGLAVRPIAFRHSIRVNEREEGNGLMRNMGKCNVSLPPSMSMSLFCTSSAGNNKSNDGAGDESPNEEEGTGSLDSGQCSGSSPPFFNNCTSMTACCSSHQSPPVALLLHHHNNYHSPSDQRHSDQWRWRNCSDDAVATSSEAGTTTSSVEMALPTFGAIEQRCSNSTQMPSYARTANCIAQVIRLSSIIFAHLGSNSSEHRRFNGTKKLLNNTKAYIRLLSECPCAAQMPQSELELVRRAMHDAQVELLVNHDNVQPNDYLGVCVRRMLEQTLLVFVRLITHYLSECANHDQLFLIALEQFVHLLLFGDELCLEAIRNKAMDNLLALALVPLTGSDTLKLLLRTISVLCGTAKGCIQLLSIGGLDLVLRVLRDSTHADCSIEAAGCLAQLCSPAHCFLRLSPHTLHSLIPRLLKLVDHSPSPEALLLCLAALANMSGQCAGTGAELLYTHNAVLRLANAAGREHSTGNLFVQEELVTIFTRMANRGFERALVAQGAIPVLCQLLQLGAIESQSQRQCNFKRRVSYKAAVCLGILASTGSGLKALYENKVHKVLSKIAHSASALSTDEMTMSSQSMAAATAPPIQLICSSISQRLQHTYQLETTV